MEFVKTLFEQQPLVALFLTIAIGYLVGEININGFSLGVGAVLFVALAVGWFAPKSAPAPMVGTIGLALFLYGISTSAEEGTFIAAKVLVPAAVGLVLILAFIAHALRSKAPLLDLRLFRNRTLSISVIAMTLFMIAFFGAALLYPQYFIGIRGESTLSAGLLLAPQGIGAMLTMPIAGRLTDKMGPGKFVLGGLVLIALGVGTFTFLAADSSYWLLCGALFVQGMGMGMTMMPIMSAALATLKTEQVPDGSTLVNVVQQTASSIGTAIISVLLASNLAAHAESKLAIASNAAPEQYDKLVAAGQAPAEVPAQWLDWGASAFAGAFVVSAVLIVVTFVPAFFLPRKRVATAESVPVLMH